MKFMLMMITDENAERALGPDAIDTIVAQHMTVSQKLRAAGKYIDSYRLRFGPEAITLRPRGGKWFATDGPFAETREVLGGFYLIEAGSKAEAIAWAKQLPLRAAGAIEIRPARTGAQWRKAIHGAQRFMLMFVASSEAPQSRADVFDAIDCHYELSLELAAQGKFVCSRALDPAATATTLRWSDGQHVVTDGPFAETKEFVAGYFVIACDAQAEAVRWAEQLAHGNAACEVRPIWAMP